MADGLAGLRNRPVHLHVVRNHPPIRSSSRCFEHQRDPAHAACDLCLSKVAALLFVRGLTLDTIDLNLTTGLCIFVGVWGVVSEFAVAFQCHLPKPWDYIHNTCFNRVAWWNFFGVVNILTEAVLIIHPVVIVSPLRTTLGKKIGIVSCFAGRIIVVVAVIIQLAYLNHAAHTGQSLLESWQNVVCSEVVQCLSIVGTCLPQFKPFLESLQSSGMRLYDIPGTTRKYGYGYGTPRGLNSHKSPQASHRGGGTIHELISVPQRLETTVTAGGKDKDWEVSSQSSYARIIRETKTWSVAEYPGQPASPGEESVRV
ncbi:hypothetical protein T310_7279 [Rasamsonia emersonii CBS 393.64]|uniref:Rhodopsin domain-containing protein n=1 Tax=Rasamsonia emersonii (strain ATCC 16479 / CBS 393.64 / IMI 116815) TaxID=1408163 RepID=A0A0F4YKF5_RASE3|nr:hypothetical protein T310_7279 [Rasamsonia emersonii CBS 393.64]KKA18757.1 hypothetical protein T310_7279 [Rasamsonia emersonii CBS 393.64]